MNQSTSIPILEDNEQQLIGVRGRLEDMVRSLNLIHDVAIVCGRACDAASSDTDAEVSNVLQMCCTNAFAKGDAIPDIAQRHNRTVRAIEARLERIGLLSADQRTTHNSFTGSPTKVDKDDAS